MATKPPRKESWTVVEYLKSSDFCLPLSSTLQILPGNILLPYTLLLFTGSFNFTVAVFFQLDFSHIVRIQLFYEFVICIYRYNIFEHNDQKYDQRLIIIYTDIFLNAFTIYSKCLLKTYHNNWVLSTFSLDIRTS